MSVDPNNFYTNLRDVTVLNSLQSFGFLAAIQVRTNGIFDPVQGIWTSEPTWQPYHCWALYGSGYSGAYAGVTRKYEQRTATRKVKKSVYIDASSLNAAQISLDTDMLFQDENGNTQEIVSVKEINVGGVVMLYQIEAEA